MRIAVAQNRSEDNLFARVCRRGWFLFALFVAPTLVLADFVVPIGVGMIAVLAFPAVVLLVSRPKVGSIHQQFGPTFPAEVFLRSRTAMFRVLAVVYALTCLSVFAVILGYKFQSNAVVDVLLPITSLADVLFPGVARIKTTLAQHGFTGRDGVTHDAMALGAFGGVLIGFSTLVGARS